jgi:hypothetical protein
MQQFLATNAPSLNIDRQMNFRKLTGGLELLRLAQATPTALTGLGHERKFVGAHGVHPEPSVHNLILMM